MMDAIGTDVPVNFTDIGDSMIFYGCTDVSVSLLGGTEDQSSDPMSNSTRAAPCDHVGPDDLRSSRCTDVSSSLFEETKVPRSASFRDDLKRTSGNNDYPLGLTWGEDPTRSANRCGDPTSVSGLTCTILQEKKEPKLENESYVAREVCKELLADVKEVIRIPDATIDIYVAHAEQMSEVVEPSATDITPPESLYGADIDVEGVAPKARACDEDAV
ncbi:hypothetical protein AALP_AA2G044600 [Arabis alpina]|uniref:Uncharacterized protein n=1 Tax=Arabis alpina TaxID=50452 RepID=A0A087HFB2_ARAAL|nr:hypothetical protein AALP_AA2G044600 [Arabis alpina]